jgi:hypothetical protein
LTAYHSLFRTAVAAACCVVTPQTGLMPRGDSLLEAKRSRPGVAMPILYRPARAQDLERADRLVVGSINDLTERHGFGAMASAHPPHFQLFSLQDDPGASGSRKKAMKSSASPGAGPAAIYGFSRSSSSLPISRGAASAMNS